MSETFGSVLKKLRKENKVTLRELSSYAGKSISYLSDVEQGRRKPPALEAVNKIEEYLNVDDGILVTLAAKLRKKVPKEWTEKFYMMPKLSEALLRADNDLTDKECEEWMNAFEEIKNKRGK